MIKNIQRNFEFLYFGKGRHLASDPKILDEPLNTLKDLGGVEKLVINEFVVDHADTNSAGNFNYYRPCEFQVKIFEFQGHSIKAYCTIERHPELKDDPWYITRIRLGGYDINDNLSFEISEALSGLPKSD
jgi:hypothetical protein